MISFEKKACSLSVLNQCKFTHQLDSKKNLGLFESLYTRHDDIVYIVDTSSLIRYYNPKAYEILNSHHRVMGTSIFSQVHHDYKDIVKVHFQKATEGIAQRFEAVFRTVEKDLYVDMTYTPIVVDEEIIGILIVCKDITKDRRREREYLRSSELLHQTQAVANIASWDYDVKQEHAYCSENLYDVLGIDGPHRCCPPHELFDILLPANDCRCVQHEYQRSVNEKRDMRKQFQIIRQNDRAERTIDFHLSCTVDHNGNLDRVIAVFQDITEFKKIEGKVEEQDLLLKNIYEGLGVGIWSMDMKEHETLYFSPRITDITGYCFQDFYDLGERWERLVHPEDYGAFIERQPLLYEGYPLTHQYRIIDKQGDVKWVQDHTTPILNDRGELIRLDGVISDISEQKRIEQQVRHLATHDCLTNIANRRQFENLLDTVIEKSNAQDEQCALIMLDLDHFKQVNDTYGHVVGDELLTSFTSRVSQLLNDRSQFARLGGDEFAILIEEIESEEEPVSFAKQLVDQMQKPLELDEMDLPITVSIGIGIYPNASEDKLTLYKQADAALYRAKESGRNTFQMYDQK
ncbi:sensor domain-containing protein [Texcoconibacillus texcoconensis]|uniref:Diguanylate cyclase (GGDEF)-like protein/PAS domain S-box-containing protein n=1 Tax=Texcoconibacillus texcoconensis TaxID=1095777 RepID=A0A840QMB4_9BACI|nr:diguanylate cyclase [Texcoconibacillus texcoconensis]MBB5172508.1 diguanylate cyclase (GGDEF)-like protein/PAS domain S-box-containing protein [Texcoconibacillus texcoconensis]